MIIFGTSNKTYQLAIINLLCGFCGNPSAHALRKRVMKFSLFFVPLFPIAPAKHSMQCTFCGAHSELSRENAEALLAQGAGTQQQPQGPAAPQPPTGNPFAGGGQQGGQPPQNPYRS